MSLRLEQAEVLVIDCQATAAAGAGGHLLELGWARCRAGAEGPSSDTVRVASCLVTPPPGAKIGTRVLSLMGLDGAELSQAESPGVAWSRLLRDSAGLAERSGNPGPDPGELFGVAPSRIPCVAHYAPFERPFLEELHRHQGAHGAFPLELICTHEIARRLLPALPRKSLRALAGYCGFPVTGARRAATHVEATFAIWRHLVVRLRQEARIETLAELHRWLREPPTRAASAASYPLARMERLDLADEPGVYRLRCAGGKVLYVGKATSLRRRVSSHYHGARRAGDRELELLSQVRAVDATVTSTALEAALLEVDEIRSHAPPYNVALRGDQLWFSSEDHSSVRPTWSATHPLGPYPAPEPIEILGLAASAILGRTPSLPPRAATLRLLGLAAWDDSNRLCLARGWELFRRRWGPSGPPAAALPSVGARIWASRVQEERESRIDGLLDPPPRRRPPEPERVAQALEAAIARAAHLTRRARWLSALLESSVLWRRRDSDEFRVLILEGGRVAGRADQSALEPAPNPPGWDLPAADRHARWDAATHDRLRVLSTELRRVLTRGREVRVRLAPRRILGPKALAWRLAWV